jgi:hypothetical protein
VRGNHREISCNSFLAKVVCKLETSGPWELNITRHVQKVSSDRAYRPRRWRERGAPARWCLRSREGYIRHGVISHSLFKSSSFCLEMSMKIENHASCEIRSVIKFLNAKNVRQAEIYRQVCEVYGQNAMSDGMVRSGVGCSMKGGRCPRWWSKWPPVLSHCWSAWPSEWEDSRKQKIRLFVYLKRFLAAEQFSSDDEVKTAMQRWVKTMAADFFDEGTQKLVPLYDRCLSLAGDYVEK